MPYQTDTITVDWTWTHTDPQDGFKFFDPIDVRIEVQISFSGPDDAGDDWEVTDVGVKSSPVESRFGAAFTTRWFPPGSLVGKQIVSDLKDDLQFGETVREVAQEHVDSLREDMA